MSLRNPVLPRVGALVALALVLPAVLSPAAAAAPVVTEVAVDPRATSAVLSFSTDVPTTATVRYGDGLARSATSGLASDHRVVLEGLSPGTAVEYEVEVVDEDALATVFAGAFSTSTQLTYWLHDTGPVQYADEFDTPGDVDFSGYNGFGAVVATANAATGTDLLAVADVYATRSGGLKLDAEGDVTGTLYVRFVASGPTVAGTGTTVMRGAPAAATFRVALLSDGAPLASGEVDVVATEVNHSFVEAPFAFDVPAASVAEGRLAIDVRAVRATAGYTFGLEGDHASHVRVPVLAGAPPPEAVAPLQLDFVGKPRVVVAVIDTGINPYHPIFQRPGIQLPLAEFADARTGLPPRVVDLADAGNYSDRVAADNATWNGIAKGELVHFADTNVLGVGILPPEGGHAIRDVQGHGSATASTVLQNFPDAVVVAIGIHNGSGLLPAMRWAVDQPWIDVVSTSWGAAANIPNLGDMPSVTRVGYDRGKVLVNSAGNDPSPLPSDHMDGPHWVIAATGSVEEGRSKEILSGNVFPDYAADYIVPGAVMDTTEPVYEDIAGTSFSCPTVAGTVAGILHGVRTAKGHTAGIVGGELAPGVTNRDVRAVLNKTAILREWDGYLVGLNWNGDHTNPPLAPYVTQQWGHVDDRVIEPSVAAILAGDYALPPEKADAARWKEATFRYRAAYWDHVWPRTD